VKVLFIDGPARGSVREVPGRSYIALVANLELTPVGSSNAVNYEQVVYHVHRFAICGRMLRLASTHSVPEELDANAAYDLIVSDAAKECAE
jgi:hypothetical protein